MVPKTKKHLVLNKVVITNFTQKVNLNLSLFEIPVGWNIGIYDDTEYQATVKKEDTWFLDDNYQIY